MKTFLITFFLFCILSINSSSEDIDVTFDWGVGGYTPLNPISTSKVNVYRLYYAVGTTNISTNNLYVEVQGKSSEATVSNLNSSDIFVVSLKIIYDDGTESPFYNTLTLFPKTLPPVNFRLLSE